MAPRPHHNSWEFTAALELLRTLRAPRNQDPLRIAPRPKGKTSISPSNSHPDVPDGVTQERAHLGDFEPVYRGLEDWLVSYRIQKHNEPSEEHLVPLSLSTLPPILLENNTENSGEARNSRAESSGEWEELPFADTDGESDKHGQGGLEEQQPIPTSPEKPLTSRASIPVLASARQLTPGWVTPARPLPEPLFPFGPQETMLVDSSNIAPLVYATREQKKVDIIRILRRMIGRGCFANTNPFLAVANYGGNITSNGIHVFVDSSNIAIGFYESLKRARGINIHTYMRRAPLSFHSLAFIMERGRGVARRVLVGSSDRLGELPVYMKEAARCGYEINALERVEKYKDYSMLPRKRASGPGYGTSGQSSGSETNLTGKKVISEQGVDEILHMKMLESLVDADTPSTIVLATGDAAEAEFSSGFLRNVMRALEKGWKIELVAWGHSMSRNYRSHELQEKWKGSFRIIELDDFTEHLLAMYTIPAGDQAYTTAPKNEYAEANAPRF